MTWERYSETTDSTTGERTETWTPVETTWCEIRPLSARERFQAEQVKADVTHSVTVRYGAVDIGPKDRGTNDGRTFYIDSVINVDESNRELRALCREQVT